MRRSIVLSRGVVLAALTGLIQSAPAFAQSADADSETSTTAVNNEAIQDIVVTGSRISRQDYNAPSPTISLTGEAVVKNAAVTVESSLSQLPQFVGSFNGTAAFPGNSGQANLNLRGLGTNRVLVLLDGRRMQPTSADGAVDVNIVPTALISNVETITGGASATYGSDAIAGVVNFRLNRAFRGFRVDGKMGLTSRGDGATRQIDATFGTDFADRRGSLIMSGSYATRDRIKRAQRSFYPSDLRIVGNAPVFGASNTIPQGTATLSNNPPSQAAVDAVFAKYGVTPGSVRPTDGFSVNANGTLFNALPTTRPVQNYLDPETEFASIYRNGVYFNANPRIDLQLPLERKSIFGMGTYDVTNSIQAHLRGYHSDYTVDRDLFESPLIGVTGTVYVPVTNPFIPADLSTLLASRANPTAPFILTKGLTQFAPRSEHNRYSVWQMEGGLEGSLGGDWKWDVSTAYGQNRLRQTQVSLDKSRIQQLFNATDGGASLCEGGFNPFGDVPVSASCQAYLGGEAVNRTRLSQRVFEGNLQGTVLELPAGPLKVAVGASNRRNTYSFVPDAIVSAANLTGFNVANASSGSQTVTEGYAELLAPLLHDIPAIEKLELGLAYRHSRYDTSGSLDTYRATVDWKVANGLSLRGGYSRAARAPSLLELFGAAFNGSTNIGDPSGGARTGDPCDFRSAARQGSDSSLVQALCIAQGVPSTAIGTFVQSSTIASTLTQGNPDLRPEKADTYSAGVVFNGREIGGVLRSFQVSIDYYKIKIGNAIATVPVDASLSRCFNYDGSNPTYSNDTIYCANIRRLTGVGTLAALSIEPQLNLATAVTTGIDVQVDWSVPVGAGQLGVNFAGTYVDSFRRTALPGSRSLDYAGSTSNGSAGGAAVPRFKSISTLSYSNDIASIAFKWRHISALKDSSKVISSTSTVPGTPAVEYFDANLTIKAAENFDIGLGVMNIGDRKPPVIAGILGNFDYATYDALGRSFFLTVSAKY